MPINSDNEDNKNSKSEISVKKVINYKREKMPQQDPIERAQNFDEVALGYDEETARREAGRCIQCRTVPCRKGCPVEIDIPVFINFIVQGNYEEAIKKIKEKINLPAICGRVCPQETQCESFCTLGKKGDSVAIGRLERFAADYEALYLSGKENIKINENKNKKIAVIGAGPAGLTCAADLAKFGYEVKIFESLHDSGGVLRYGIPEFRLPKAILDREVKYIERLGVKIEYNMIIGRVLSIQDIMKEFQAVFIGSGAGLPYFLKIPGENLNGVYSANEFLTRVNLMKAYKFPEYDTPVYLGKRVGVMGGGNVAMDSARVAKRLGAEEVHIIYRRSGEELPARKEEVEHAHEEGIKFTFLTNPIGIIGDNEGNVKELKCNRMELGEPDTSGRRRPVPIPDSEFSIQLDTVIVAIGQGPNPLIPQTTKELNIGKHGNIVIDEITGKTSISGVYAGGDVATGAATVIKAMGAGKIAAHSIDEYLTGSTGI
ncbi:MAG: NADPH-dependent glutamate synthase [Candidatus Firestonebacteria bacterium]|nr:NADPH-dependent glutamate synthase [Candidatus Firestonebacteria bacterium]